MIAHTDDHKQKPLDTDYNDINNTHLFLAFLLNKELDITNIPNDNDNIGKNTLFHSTNLTVVLFMKIKEDSYVLLFHTHSKKWLAKVSLEKKLHTHLGVIDIAAAIGMDYGSSILTTEGKKIYLVEPTVYDFVMKSKRSTQIIYPKDLGFIAARTGLQNGSRVLEVGTGSGALTTFMASIVKPNGHVYTFDINEDFLTTARHNLEKAGMIEYVTMLHKDIHDGIPLTDIDFAVVDLGDPWSVLKEVHRALKGSGSFVAICPTMNQLEKTSMELKQNGYIDVESIELMIRNIEAREGMTRPSMRMIGHTTYLIFARKALLEG